MAQGQRFSLGQQVENFENTLSQLKNEMSDEEISQYLFKSLVIMILGSNDYINNPKEYADLLIERYAMQILVRLDPYYIKRNKKLVNSILR